MLSILHDRRVRRLLWTLATLITFWALLSATLRWTGQRRWLDLQRELHAQKETLDLLKLLPPAIPNERNVAAIEPLNGIRLAPGNSPAAKAAAAKRDAISKACQFLRGDLVSKALASFSSARAQRPELAKIIAALQEQKQLALPANADAAALRRALEQHLPVLVQLAETASTHPDVEFLPRLDTASLPESLFELAMPHFSVTQDLTRALCLHGLACLESGDPAAAAGDVIAVLRLAEGALKEPFLISHLVGITQLQKAAELTWLFLQKRALNAGMIASLQQGFQHPDIPASLCHAMRGEMAAGADMGELMERDAARAAGLFSVIGSDGKVTTGAFDKAFANCVPSGLFTHMKTSLVQAEWEYLLHPIRDHGLKDALARPDPLDTWLKSQSLLTRPDLFLTRFALPAVGQVKRNSALAENTRRQTLIACALELHFLQHGSYPAKLGDLTNTPATAFDETPMHYRPSADGRYRLWHAGPDGQDDDGALPMEKSALKTHSYPQNPDYLGDWTWRYEPLKQK
jgi:hypothetical protein